MSDEERNAEAARRLGEIESVGGGEGGEVGIFNINHLGGHRYAGVMLVSCPSIANAELTSQILFPSGAYISYGRVTPQEVPRIVEETIVRGEIVPGLLRNAVEVTRQGGKKTVDGHGILAW